MVKHKFLKVLLATTCLAGGLFAGMLHSIALVVPEGAMMNPAAVRKITITRVTDGSGNMDTQALVDGTGALTNGWVADDSDPQTTYQIFKVQLNSGQTTPTDNGFIPGEVTPTGGASTANYKLIAGAEVTTVSGSVSFEIGDSQSGATGSAIDYTATGTYDTSGTFDESGVTSTIAQAFFKNLKDDGTVDDTNVSPDGIYFIREKNPSAEYEAYRGFISIPNFAEITTGDESAVSGTYDVHLYPKRVRVAGLGIHSYVNIIDPVAHATMPRFATNNANDAWLHDTVANGQVTNWTQTANLPKSFFDNYNPTGVSGVSLIEMWYAAAYTDPLAYGENKASGQSNFGSSASGLSPTPLGAGVTFGTPYGSGTNGQVSAGAIITKLSDGTKDYIPLYKGSSLQATSSNVVVNITTGTKQSHLTIWGNNTVIAANANAPVGCFLRSNDKATFLALFDETNELGGDYTGINLLDASSGYSVELAFTVQMAPKGLNFTQDKILGDFAANPIRPTVLSGYALDVTNLTHNVVTTKGNDTFATNGFVTDGAGRDDGVRSATNPNGVLIEQAYVTTGNLNGVKVNEIGKRLGNAKFKLKLVDSKGEDAADEGKYLKVSTSDGTWSYVTDVAQATEYTTDTGNVDASLLGKFQWLSVNPKWDYQLIETTAPTGYQLLAKPLAIPTANMSELTWDTDNTNDDLVNVVNIRKTVLPVTGGIGLGIIILVGMAFLIFGIVNKRKHDKTE
ncbi:hypothetical protein SAMN02745116_00161 [Pilibacter termitis]|uniref:SpaA-like prealbumin fold domain-containing protein n=1 Tax=Pilibacter termitis TaxID=263852 RepID=A0A1T4KB10_9ENTE|nr:hypothetical protein [Pilibacter termitis]SJZ39589.1 hypothetical protein SAMN02745116_00161 [Pilibacter termitis]